MKKIHAVPVTGEDLIAVVAVLARRIWPKHYIPIIGRPQTEYMLEQFQSPKAIDNQIKKEGYLYYLLKDLNNEWIGYFGVIPKSDELFLSKLYITAENRGKGYGRWAMGFIENLAGERNLSKIGLTVNKHNVRSIKIYESLGFVIKNSLMTQIGNDFVMDDYRMEKNYRL